MRKTLIALVLCAVLVSTVSLTSVVSARQVSSSSSTVKQNGIAFVIAAIYKFWQSKLNPTLGEVLTLVTLAMQNIVS